MAILESSLFRAVAGLLLENETVHFTLRCKLIIYMKNNRRVFLNFVKEGFDKYIVRMSRCTTYANTLEIEALAMCLNKRILVYSEV